MKYVRRVQSTIKKGVDLSLEPRTLLVGRNNSGKSSCVQAIQIATCGFAYDVEERVRVAQHTVLARLFSPDGPWVATVEFAEDNPREVSSADTKLVSWELIQSGKGFKKPEPAPMAMAFPVQAVLESLQGSPDTLRAWLEGLTAPVLDVDSFAALLPPATRSEGGAFAKRHKTFDFLALGKLAATEAAGLKTRAGAKEGTVDTMMAGVPVPLLDDRRALLLEEQQELVSALTRAGPAPGTISPAAHAAQLADFSAIEQRYAALQVQRDALNLEGTTPALAQAGVLWDKLYAILVTHATEFGMDGCVVCGVGTAAQLEENAASIIQQREVTTDALANLRKYDALQGEMTKMESAYATQHAAFEQLRIASPVEGDAASQRARLTAMRAQIASDDAARIAWKNRDAAALEVEQLRVRSDALHALGSMFKRVGTKQLKAAKDDFEDAVSAFLPDNLVCEIDLALGRVGIKDGDTLVTTLAGARGMQLLFALGSYLAGRNSTPSLLTNPDRAWSSDTLEATMIALTDAPCQVLLTSTVEPAHPVPGWLIIRLD